MLREKKRLQLQRKSPDKNTYLLDSILHLLNVTISYDSITEIPVSKAFLMTELLSSYAGDLSLDKKYIFVDEFQDLSPNELRLVQKLYPNSVFNLFGDLSQCISEKEFPNLPRYLKTSVLVLRRLYQKTIEMHVRLRNMLTESSVWKCLPLD